MNLVNNLSGNANKASSVPATILATLNASVSEGQMADKMFADILSENQPPSKTDAEAQSQANAKDGTQQASSQASSTQANQNNAASGSNQNDANNSAQQATSHAAVSTANGKTDRHHVSKQDAVKGKSQTDKKTDAKPADNVSVTAQANTQDPTVTAAAGAAQAGDQAGDASSADNTDSSADTGDAQATAADLNAAANPPVPPVAQTPDAAQAAQTLAATQGTQTPVAPQPADAKSADAATNADGSTTAANSDANNPQLALLLMQLERLAAAARQAGPATTAAQDPNAALNAAVSADATQGKTDLKSLLAAITKSKTPDLLGNDNLTDPSNSTATNQDAQSAQGAANSAPVTTNAQQTSQQAQAPQAGTDKWMNDSFANLFNVTNSNQINTNIPVAVNAAGAAGITLGANDGASLDADTQGQNQAGSRDIAANTSANNNPLPTAGSAQATNPYDFASELSNLRATKGGATGLPTPVEQVVLQLRNGISKDGSTQMTIQLRPAELGRIDVKLNVSSDGKVQGTVTADHPATLNMLLKDAKGLERALQDAGLSADSGSLQFNLRGDQQSGSSFNQTANNSSNFTGNASQDASTQLPVFADAAETYYLTPGGVNMRV